MITYMHLLYQYLIRFITTTTTKPFSPK
uniref:Uncharacterized protein n=1 Tax=Arundo donax TaxID=35708 RepID=A0A0A9BLA5_ARUDO